MKNRMFTLTLMAFAMSISFGSTTRAGVRTERETSMYSSSHHIPGGGHVTRCNSLATGYRALRVGYDFATERAVRENKETEKAHAAKTDRLYIKSPVYRLEVAANERPLNIEERAKWAGKQNYPSRLREGFERYVEEDRFLEVRQN